MGVEATVKPHPSDVGFDWEVKKDGARRGFGWCASEGEADRKIKAVIEEQRLEDEGEAGRGTEEGRSAATDRREGR